MYFYAYASSSVPLYFSLFILFLLLFSSLLNLSFRIDIPLKLWFEHKWCSPWGVKCNLFDWILKLFNCFIFLRETEPTLAFRSIGVMVGFRWVTHSPTCKSLVLGEILEKSDDNLLSSSWSNGINDLDTDSSSVKAKW